MMSSRKIVLDKNKKELLDSVNASNKVYTNEELSILLDEQQEQINTLKNENQILKDSIYTKEKVDELVQGTLTGYLKEIDLTNGYNENVWYPVVAPFNTYGYSGYRRTRCIALLYESGIPSWATHEYGFTTSIDLLSQGGNWGAQPARTVVLANEYKFATTAPVGYYNFGAITSQVFYLRGGGKYRLYTDYPTTWNLYTSKHIINSQYNHYVEPKSSNPGITADTEVVTIK